MPLLPQARVSLVLLLRIPLLVLLIVTQTVAQAGPSGWSATPFNTPALPLAVRSPYLNTWLAQGNNPAPLYSAWPNLWNIDAITGWYSSVVVDGQAYKIMGAAVIANVTNANQTAVEFTPTRTSFIFTAGLMEINATFISPIEPTDLVRQSLPFSYYSLSATSTDGKAHTLRMYSDISGEFIAGDPSQLAVWNADDEGEYTILSMQLQTQQKYTEVNNHAQDATEYYSFKKLSGTTSSWAITEDTVNRGNAANISTTLGNQADAPPRAVEINWPTLGIAVDWGSISSTPEPAVWAIGVMRNPSIQYQSPSGHQDRLPYFLSTWVDGPTATKAFLDDFSRASSASSAFDAQLSSAGSHFSGEYADLLALSARQAMGSMDITLTQTGSGDWNFSDTKAFMKNMGGVGSDAAVTTMSVNTVDTLYAAFPIFMYLNPELGGYLLAPLLEYQDSPAYSQSYAAKNIGTTYPNATADGITDAHDYGIEESANMLIMTLAYSQRSGNGTFLSKHYTLLRGWAEYLENNTLTPLNQKSADSTSDSQVSNNNQTNTALKGIIGIACMAKIAEIAGVSDDQQKFNGTAVSYISQWQSNSIAPDNSHIDFFYGQSNSNGLIYNLYADKLLQLDLVSDSVYQVATVFYNNIANQDEFGLPLDNGESGRTTTTWMMFSASTVANAATQNYMVNQIHQYASSNQNNTPFSSVYSPSTGTAAAGSNAGQNSPTTGGIFALLALNTTIQSSISMPQDGSTIPGGASSSSSSSKSSNVGAIAGGVVGGLVGLGIIGFGIFFCMRRRRNLHVQEMYDTRVNPMVAVSTSPSSYSSARGKLPGFNDGTTFEPFRYSDTAHNVSGPPLNSQAHVVGYAALPPGGESLRSPRDDAAVYGVHESENARDSTYFRTHRPGESDDIGPSASQVGGSSATSSGRGSGSGRGSSSRGASNNGRGRGQHSVQTPSDGTAPQQVMLAKQTLVNEELRSEVDNLRRDLERIREERQAGGLLNDEAPPSYDEPI